MFRAFIISSLLLADLPAFGLSAKETRSDQIRPANKIEMMSDLKSKNTQYIESYRTDHEALLRESKLAAAKNNGGWGGGTGVIRGSQAPILYDLYMTHPDYEDAYQIAPNLVQTRFLKRMGYEHISIHQMAEYSALMQLLNAWRPNAKGLVALIEESLHSMTLSYTTTPLIRIDGLVESTPLKPGHYLEPVIVFNKTMGARIYVGLWNQLGDRSRIAALVHESLRHIQIADSKHESEPDFDLKIQRLTNFLLMTDPAQFNGQVDYRDFFSGSVLRTLSMFEMFQMTLVEYFAIMSGTKTAAMRAQIQKPEVQKDYEENNRKEFQKYLAERKENQFKYSIHRSESGYKKELSRIENLIRMSVDDSTLMYSRSQRIELEAYADGLKMFNKFIQERWLDNGFWEIYGDLRELIVLQIENPKLKVFQNMQIYNCYTRTDWLTPVERYQDRNTEKFNSLRKAHQAEHEKCMTDGRFANKNGVAEYNRQLGILQRHVENSKLEPTY